MLGPLRDAVRMQAGAEYMCDPTHVQMGACAEYMCDPAHVQMGACGCLNAWQHRYVDMDEIM